MGKPIFRALVVGLLFVFVYYAVQIIQGMYLAMNYVPDLLERYNSVNYLQRKVTFGAEYRSLWRMAEAAGVLLLGMVVYYTGRKWRGRK